jgi:hypothetical protein
LAFSFIAISLAYSSSGQACSRNPFEREPTEEELFSQARSVFVAHLTSVKEVAAPESVKEYYQNIIEGNVTIIEIIKGTPPLDGKVRSMPYGYGNCTIPFLVGADYLFFLSSDDEYISFLAGSGGPILNLNALKVQEKLRNCGR